MIIDTSNALAAPGSSRGYACLSVARRSIAPPDAVRPGRGWGPSQAPALPPGRRGGLRPPKGRPGASGRARPARGARPSRRPAVGGGRGPRPARPVCGAREAGLDRAGRATRRRPAAGGRGRPSARMGPPRAAPPRRPLLLLLFLSTATSDQTWRPAEFKHISQRRKRN